MGLMKWLAKHNIQGIVKSQVSKYEHMKKTFQGNDTVIIQGLFESRFDRRFFGARRAEKERIEEYLQREGSPKSLFDLCLAIGEIEFSPVDLQQYFFIHDIMFAELERLGYKVEPRPTSFEQKSKVLNE